MHEGNDGGEERRQRQQRANDNGGDNEWQWRRIKWRHNENLKNIVQGNEIVVCIKTFKNNGRKETNNKNKRQW